MRITRQQIRSIIREMLTTEPDPHPSDMLDSRPEDIDDDIVDLMAPPDAYMDAETGIIDEIAMDLLAKVRDSVSLSDGKIIFGDNMWSLSSSHVGLDVIDVSVGSSGVTVKVKPPFPMSARTGTITDADKLVTLVRSLSGDGPFSLDVIDQETGDETVLDFEIV